MKAGQVPCWRRVETIEATNWAAIPGFPKFYEPDVIAPALRRLAAATSPTEAAMAAGPLFGRGLIHEHSGGAHPASVVAAPILLDIAEHAHLASRPSSLELVSRGMYNDPYAGFTTLATADGPALCCAIARIVRARQATLSTLGGQGKALLAQAAEHWRFTVHEAVHEDGLNSALALGELEGTPEIPAGLCDIRCPGRTVVRLKAAITAADARSNCADRTYLTITGLGPEYLSRGTTIWSPCTDRVH